METSQGIFHSPVYSPSKPGYYHVIFIKANENISNNSNNFSLYFSFGIHIGSVSYSVVLVTQSYLILCDPMDCSPPGSSVRGILQARILEQIAIPFSRGSSQPRDQIQVFWVAGRFLPFELKGSPLYPICNNKIQKFHASLVTKNLICK